MRPDMNDAAHAYPVLSAQGWNVEAGCRSSKEHRKKAFVHGDKVSGSLEVLCREGLHSGRGGLENDVCIVLQVSQGACVYVARTIMAELNSIDAGAAQSLNAAANCDSDIARPLDHEVIDMP